ncbi:MAG TPA: hypothetical protein VFA07_06865 [Chthonomonadaceae bacterium]|nr:hypothetical protein [Chthonomonadaceae bacterium]
MDINLTCRFKYQFGQADLDCRLIQNPDCSIYITVEVPFSAHPYSWEKCCIESIPSSTRLLLTPVQGYAVQKTIPFPLQSKINVKLAEAELKEAILPNEQDLVTMRAYPTHIPYWNIPNRPYQLKLFDKRITIRPHSEGLITHIAEIENIQFSEYTRFQTIIEQLYWLVSFASGRLCKCCRFEIVKDSNPVLINAVTPDISIGEGKFVIREDGYSKEITKFVEQSVDPFVRLDPVYQLINLIHINTVSKDFGYPDLNILLIANFFEVIRYNFALNIGVPSGIYRRDGDDFKHTSGPRIGKNASFLEIMSEFCRQNHINGWKSDYKDWRNEIIHTGKLSCSNSDKASRYFELLHFCDKIILSLLDWDKVGGHYMPADKYPTYITREIEPDGRIKFSEYLNLEIFVR